MTASEESDWDRAALPVLEWLQSAPMDVSWRLDRSDGPSEEVPSLSGVQLDASLRRLAEAGLVAGDRQESVGYFYWSSLRLTPNGLRVLGEWPPDPRASLDAALILVLKGLSENAETEDEGKPFRRAAGVIGRFGTTVVAEAFKGEMRRLGGDLG